MGAAVGGALVAFGLRGLLVFEPRGAASALRWLVGVAVVLDLLVVPVLAAVGWLGHRWLPRWAWRLVRAGLVVTAALVVFALPLVLGWGEAPGNPTVRPRDEREGLLVAVGWTWMITGAALGIAAWRRSPIGKRREVGVQGLPHQAVPTSADVRPRSDPSEDER